MNNANNVNRVIQCEGCGADVAIKRGPDRMCPACQRKAAAARKAKAADALAAAIVRRSPIAYPNEPFYAGL